MTAEVFVSCHKFGVDLTAVRLAMENNLKLLKMYGKKSPNSRIVFLCHDLSKDQVQISFLTNIILIWLVFALSVLFDESCDSHSLPEYGIKRGDHLGRIHENSRFQAVLCCIC